MGYFTDAVFSVYHRISFLQHNYPEEFNRNHTLVDNPCIRDQPYYDRCFMAYLHTRQYNIP